MNALESELQSALLLAAPGAIPDLRLFRRNIGRAKFGKATVAFGVAGMADLWGYWRGGGATEIEIKAVDGRLLKEQLAWAAFCREWRVPHAVLRARAGESVGATTRRWIEEIRLLRYTYT